MTSPSLPLTGERTVPGVAVENYWYRRHEAAYRAVEGLLGNGLVVEVGVGEGYGAALLSGGTGRRMVGVDYDPAAVAHVRRRYGMPAVRGNAVGLPFADASVDAVVSMQVIEHLWNQPAHVAECARVLRPGGTLVVSTPNRLTFSPGYDPATDRPRNLFHSREFAAAELAALIARWFPTHTGYGLRAGAALRSADDRCRTAYGTDLAESQLALPAERWPADLAGMVAGVRATDFELSTVDIDAALDLVVVAQAAPDA